MHPFVIKWGLWMLPRAYNFFPKASIQVGQTPTFSAPTHKYQQASAGLGFQAENKPLVPPRPTLPGLEPTAVSQSWEQGSFTWQCLRKKDAVKPLRPLCLWAVHLVSLHSHQHLSGFKAHGSSFQLLALFQVAEEAGRITPPSLALQFVQTLATFSRHWRGCLGIQRWPQLLRTQVHRFYCMLLHCASQIQNFFKLKVCGNPASIKSIDTIFPTEFAHFVSLCDILVIFEYFKLFQ